VQTLASQLGEPIGHLIILYNDDAIGRDWSVTRREHIADETSDKLQKTPISFIAL